jgi:hypothetical protein
LSKFNLALTKRDREILQFIFEQRAVSFKQIWNRFFKNVTYQVAHARLEKLTKYKFLTKSYTLLNQSRTVFYGITEKGIRNFCQQYHFEITNFDCKSDSVNHDLGLVLVRERLEQTKQVQQYLSESMLQNCNDLANSEKFREFSIINSDAALEINTSNRTFNIALEYEISDKQESRYSKKLTEYYFSPTIALVFYICKNNRVEKLIRAVDLEVGKKHRAKVFTCLEETFHSSVDFLPFCNRSDATFKLQ